MSHQSNDADANANVEKTADDIDNFKHVEDIHSNVLKCSENLYSTNTLYIHSAHMVQVQKLYIHDIGEVPATQQHEIKRTQTTANREKVPTPTIIKQKEIYFEIKINIYANE